MDWTAKVPPGGFWVFGYGSLMWQPGFPHEESQPARVHGYHRALCLWSWRYRGSRETPGLVLGLDRGGSCPGMAFRVPRRHREQALRLLDDREMGNRSYRPLMLPARLADGRRVRLLTFVISRDNPQYAGKLEFARIVEVVHHAYGERGPNRDYVLNTVDHLAAMGFPCARLRAVARALERAR